jgi:tetrahydromethanopterin S-methyltransferase subunit G
MEQKRIKILISVTVLALLTITNLSFAAKEVPYTLEDRDRLIRVEEGLKAVNQRIDGLEKSVNQRIDGLQNLIYVLIGAVIAQTIGIVGFTLWDRRSALAPAIRKNKEIEEREEKIEKALKEVAQKDPNVAEALKHVGLL